MNDFVESEMPDDKIRLAMVTFGVFSDASKAGFMTALAICGCHQCTEILERIQKGDLR